MKVIPVTYLLEEGNEAAADTTVVECPICKRKFAVPTSELDTEVCCSECEDTYNKQKAAESINDMKYEHSSEKDAIDAALGQ